MDRDRESRKWECWIISTNGWSKFESARRNYAAGKYFYKVKILDYRIALKIFFFLFQSKLNPDAAEFVPGLLKVTTETPKEVSTKS